MTAYRRLPRITERPDEPAPVIPCDCCKVPLRTDYQPGWGMHDGYWLITCDNLDCDLEGQTATPSSYPFPNMERYLAYGRAHREERALRKRALELLALEENNL